VQPTGTESAQRKKGSTWNHRYRPGPAHHP